MPLILLENKTCFSFFTLKKRLLPVYFLGLLLFFSCFLPSAFAQKDSLFQPKLQFLEDTLFLGKPTPVALSFKYPKEWQVVFADTNFKYFPFELDKKIFFTTQTDSLYSLDSAIYLLRSFEIEKVQRLRLPIYKIKPQGDSTIFFSNTDSIFFQELIRSNALDTLALKADTEMVLLAEKFNIHLWVFVLMSSIFGLGIIWIFFGDWIKKQIILLNLKQKHIRFEENFSREINKIKSRKRIKDIELALLLWKKHLEQIEEKPFSSYTTREIVEVLPIDRLGDSLQNIDKAIYGTIIEDDLDKDLTYLKTLAHRRYIRRKKMIRGN
jgi:hypothetical protein